MFPPGQVWPGRQSGLDNGLAAGRAPPLGVAGTTPPPSPPTKQEPQHCPIHEFFMHLAGTVYQPPMGSTPSPYDPQQPPPPPLLGGGEILIILLFCLFIDGGTYSAASAKPTHVRQRGVACQFVGI